MVRNRGTEIITINIGVGIVCSRHEVWTVTVTSQQDFV
jgi:hypothetical protein